MPPPVWSTQQLAEFLAAVSSSETEASAALAAVERAAEALDAEVAAILCDGEVVAAVGYSEGAAPAAELASVAAGATGAALSVPGVGACPATGVALEHPPGGILLLARSGSDGLSREEASLLRGMARVTSLTMRTLHLLDNERAAHEKSDRHAAENARLLGTLGERQAMLERLAEEQAALRRVATLVAGQAVADVIFTAVAEEVARLLRADVGGVARHGPDESLALMAEWNEGLRSGLPIGTRIGLEGESGVVRRLRSGHPVRLSGDEGLPEPIAGLVRDLGIRSTIGAPIVVDGAVWGAIWARRWSAALIWFWRSVASWLSLSVWALVRSASSARRVSTKVSA